MRLKIKDIIFILLLNVLFIVGIDFILSFFNEFGVESIFSVLIVLIILFLFKFNFKELKGNKNFYFKDIFYVIVLFFPLALLGRIIAPKFDNFFVNLYGLIDINSYFVFMILSILPLFKEELLERTMQIKLSKTYGTLITMIFLSLNFALLHFIYFDLFLGIVTSLLIFFASFILVSFFEKTRSLFTIFIAHVFYDFLIVMQIYLHLNNILFEYIFWIVYGVIFLIFAKMAWSRFLEGINKNKYIKPYLSDWIFLVIFGFLPLIINLILRKGL